jgi:hypothetical protein
MLYGIDSPPYVRADSVVVLELAMHARTRSCCRTHVCQWFDNACVLLTYAAAMLAPTIASFPYFVSHRRASLAERPRCRRAKRAPNSDLLWRHNWRREYWL